MVLFKVDSLTFVANDSLYYFVALFPSFFGVVDMITVIPTFVSEFAFRDRISYDEVFTLMESINYVIYGFRTVRILRVLRVYKHFANIEDPVRRFLYQLALTFITMLLFGN